MTLESLKKEVENETPDVRDLLISYIDRAAHLQGQEIAHLKAEVIEADHDGFERGYQEGQKDGLEKVVEGFNKDIEEKATLTERARIIKLLKALKIKDTKGKSIDRWNYLIKSIATAIEKGDV